MRGKTKFKIIVAIALIILITVGLGAFARKNVIPVIKTLSLSTIQNYCVNAINNAAHMVIDDKLQYDDLVNLVKSPSGEIELIQANTVKMNRLARDMANLAQSNVDEISEQTVSLPIGVFTGSPILAGLGPSFDLALRSIGNVLCTFVSTFDSVGINQTRHSLYINVESEVSIVLPISTVPVRLTTSVLVCENVIIGKVPEVYIGNGGNSDYLNLIPVR